MMKRIFWLCLYIFLVGISKFACAQLLSANGSNFSQEVLQVHNQLRAWHHAPKLQWDAKLARYAERHANQCKFKHSASPYGENLAAGFPTITFAVQAWYEEIAKYSFDHPGFTKGTGHFTQLIWRDSKRVGCAYTVCDGKHGIPGLFFVCEYDPPGNVINKGYFKANVLPE